MEEVLDQVTNDYFGLSYCDDRMGEGEGIYAYLGKKETNNLELNFLASLIDHVVEHPSHSGGLDIEHSGCDAIMESLLVNAKL